MSGRVVLIEGLDLAGKTTLARALERSLSQAGVAARTSRNALCPDNPVAQAADRLRRDPEAGWLETGCLFLSAHLWDARHFRPPPAGAVHVQDSCWLRTLAMHRLRGTPPVAGLLEEAARTFPRFDAAVFLTAGLATRRHRLEARLRDAPDDVDHLDHAVARDPDGFVALDKLLQRLAVDLVGAHVLDTTELTAGEVELAAAQLLGLAD